MNKAIFLRLAVCFMLFLGVAIGFAQLADEVHEGETLAFDQSILRAINTTASPIWNTFYVNVTHLGGVVAVVGVTVVALGILLARKHYKQTVIVAASVGGAALISIILKLLFERARPELWDQLVTETSYSFPSGHAMMSSVLAFTAIALCWRTRYRIAVIIAAVFYMFLVGYSRLYLGVHYPTDVVAGWLVSASWVLIVVAVVNGWVYRKAKKPLHTDAL